MQNAKCTVRSSSIFMREISKGQQRLCIIGLLTTKSSRFPITPMLCCSMSTRTIQYPSSRYMLTPSPPLFCQFPHCIGWSPVSFNLVMRPVECPQTNSPHMNHSTNTVPIIIPASLNMATLFPLAAIRPSLPAEPFRFVLIEENVSDYSMLATTPM